MQIPKVIYGRLVSRSGLTLYQRLTVVNSVINPNYIGNLGIGIAMFNYGNIPKHIKKGERLDQIIVEKKLEGVVLMESTKREEKMSLMDQLELEIIEIEILA